MYANQFILPVVKQQRKVYIKKEDKSKMQKRIPYKLKKGDHVRISYKRQPFERVYDQKFSGEHFKVSKRYTRQGIPVYRLEDMSGEMLEGSFYENEVQRVKVPKNKQYKIDKVLKYKKVGRQKQALVRWLFWPAKFDSWVPVSRIKDIAGK